MTKSIREELAVLIRDTTDCGVSIDGMPVFCDDDRFGMNGNPICDYPVCDCKQTADAILAALPSLGHAKREDVLEEAAGIVDAECERILSKQKPNATPGSTNGDINQNLRMVAVMLPEVASAIRALKSAAPSQEKP